MTTCSIAGCGSAHYAKGYCFSHYRRMLRHGDPLGGQPPRGKNDGPCSVEGCDEPSAKKGLCNAHYLRHRRYGRLESIHPWKGSGNHCGGECPGAKKIRAHMEYVLNPQASKDRAEDWRQSNPERYRTGLKEYLGREDVQVRARIRTKNWTKANPAKKRAMDKAFAEANRSLVTSYKAARRARVLQATPAWLTQEHWAQIRSVYAEAQRLAKETGIPHDVDHIVPLQGKTVCGLHVPWNLRAIPRDENNRRPRVWVPD